MPQPGPDLSGATVIFDLDGTLVDTAPDLVRALNAVMDAQGYPPVPIEEVRHMVGRGARALLRRAYSRVGAAIPEPALNDRVRDFLEAYADDIAAHSRFFPGAEAALDRVAAAGARAVIATNKPQRLTDLLMHDLGVADRFERIVGADMAPYRKPHASHLLVAAGSEAALKRAVMIGDSSVDVAAARAARVPVIVVAHGYSETPVERLGADVVLGGFDRLEFAVADLLTPARA